MQSAIVQNADEEDSAPSLRENYAAALALAGREEAADRVLTTVKSASDRTRLECVLQYTEQACGPPSIDLARFSLLVHYLSGAEYDPFAYMEKTLSLRRYTSTLWDWLHLAYVEKFPDQVLMTLPPDIPRRPYNSVEERPSVQLDTDLRKAANAVVAKIADQKKAYGPQILKSAAMASPSSGAMGEGELPYEVHHTGEYQPLHEEDNPISWYTPGRPRLPDGFWPVRTEYQNERVAVIAVSQAVDPAGEVTRGGYWLLMSFDDGISWSAPRYLGLPEAYPYVVVPESDIPLVEGDRLRVEVEIREIDLTSISFPPLDLKYRRVERDLYLETFLPAIRADSDKDGLTDILERRIGLLPESADSDGDGISDDMDAMPNAPLQQDANADWLVPLTLVLERVLSVNKASDAGKAQEEGRRHTPAGEKTVFLYGDSSKLGKLNIPTRLLVLDERALEAMQESLPYFSFLRVPLAAISRDGQRAIVIWSFGWRGGRALLHKSEGEWKIESRIWAT